MLDSSPPTIQLTDLDRENALRDLCASFTWPLDDWALGLIPNTLSCILSTIGFGVPDTWRGAVTAIRDYWDLVSRDRRASSPLDDETRLERRVSRQKRFRGHVAMTLHVSETSIVDHTARRYGIDRGRLDRL